MIIQDVIDILTINESKIIGSYNDKNLKYFSDIDLQDRILHISISKFLEIIKNKIRIINKNTHIYFQDFKLGKFRDKTIKWSEMEILKGEKEHPLKKEKLTLEELMYTKSIIKLDVTAYIEEYKRFIDFSINYYFIHEGLNTRPDFFRDLMDEYRYEYFKYVESGNYMKAIKRLYKLAKIKDTKYMIHKISIFLNSDIGYKAFLRNSIDTLMNVSSLDNFKSWNYYTDEIRNISNKLKFHGMRNLADDLNKVKYKRNKDEIKDGFITLIAKLDSLYINPQSFKFIQSLNNLREFLESTY